MFRRFFKKNALFNDIINFFCINFKAGGYYAVYGVSFLFTILGLFYVHVIPESVVKRDVIFQDEKQSFLKKITSSYIGCYKYVKWDKLLLLGILNWNQYLCFLLRTLKKSRPNGEQKFLYAILFIMIFDEIGRFHNGLLYTQKKFGWQVTDYTNYSTYVKLHNKLSCSFNSF